MSKSDFDQICDHLDTINARDARDIEKVVIMMICADNDCQNAIKWFSNDSCEWVGALAEKMTNKAYKLIKDRAHHLNNSYSQLMYAIMHQCRNCNCGVCGFDDRTSKETEDECRNITDKFYKLATMDSKNKLAQKYYDSYLKDLKETFQK